MSGVRRRIPELTLVEHELTVPLDHAGTRDETITVFARELIGDQHGAADFPLLVFFQGGPGFEAPRPPAAPDPRSWLGRALREYRVLMLDERGTGRSTPVGHLAGLDPEAQAAYLTNFRADSIVRDAELFREALGADRWSVMGQSFGGFCVLAYLSAFPHGLARGVHLRRVAAGRPADRRRLRANVCAGARPLPQLLRALPRRQAAGTRDPPAESEKAWSCSPRGSG